MLKYFLDFQDIDENALAPKRKNFKFYIILVTLALVYFIAKFTIQYNYQKFFPLFLILFLLVNLSYPVITQLTKNTFKAFFGYFFFLVTFLGVLIFMAGGV